MTVISIDNNMSTTEKVLEHAKRHVSYPTTGKEIKEACNRSSDIPAEDRDWFIRSLPERMYSDPSEVFKALLDKV